MNQETETALLKPETPLEITLAAAQNGELASVDFLRELAEAEVYILINGAAAREEQPEDVEPLVLLDEREQSMLAAFTQRDRAAIMTRRFPDFSFALEVPFTWVVSNCGAEMGIVLNPGWSVGATLPPRAVAHMRQG